MRVSTVIKAVLGESALITSHCRVHHIDFPDLKVPLPIRLRRQSDYHQGDHDGECQSLNAIVSESLLITSLAASIT